ncbi:MAG TPA: rhodanese-like domain-containing protein [Chloroflexota bacterium]|jgi:rhodanese-related sulfurtransferase|uniref:Rhodanese-like domain-containing protein n=1 Tax=Thermorudis sp. TaxID=1969470 RepID=A0A7C3APG3_9BACT
MTEEREPFERVTVEQAKEMIDRGEVTVIDVREPWEYQRGHVPGAQLIPLNQILTRGRELLQGKESILFVCGVGERSAVACEAAAAFGLKKLYNLEGGTQRWVKLGLPVEQ